MVRIAGSVLLLVLAAAAASAHPLAPSLLELRELGDGRVDVGWKPPLLRARRTALEPALPARCRPLGPRTGAEGGGGAWTRWRVDCGDAGLVGRRLGIAATDAGATAGAVVRATLADGRVIARLVTPGRPLPTVPAVPAAAEVASDRLRFGVVHVLSGPEPPLFVFGLVLLAVTPRRVAATVTACTLGHGVTRTLAVLGFVSWPSRAIEAAIAARVPVHAMGAVAAAWSLERAAAVAWPGG